VVFGHSHIPWHQIDVRGADGHVQHHVNPGSAMQRRSAPEHTAATLQLRDGVVVDVSHIVLR
jgi:predicted phosphodiesterase